MPLFSWHHASFDTEPEVPAARRHSMAAFADYGACRWPASINGTALAPGPVPARVRCQAGPCNMWSTFKDRPHGRARRVVGAPPGVPCMRSRSVVPN